jgi:hypothetical protein
MPRTEEVFGIKAGPVLSYVVRANVDDRFQAAIGSGHHIVVYGSSKQGKTSLREKYISSRECIVVRCGPTMTTKSIYNSVLRQSDVKIETVETRATGIHGEVKSKVGFKAIVPWLGAAKAEAEGTAGADHQLSLTRDFIAFDFDEAQSIGELLTAIGFKRFVVLENFHYLPSEVQAQLAFDLKTFHEIGIRFVILGIWKEANMLAVYNNDLADRLNEVPVEPWTDSDFRAVAKRGCDHLNITIADDDIDDFIANSYGNVGMFQEFLKQYCAAFNVTETVAGNLGLSSNQKVGEVLNEKLEAQRLQLLKALEGISARSRVRSDEGDPLLLPHYMVRVICRTSVNELRDGIEKNRLLDLIREIHHRNDKDTIRIGDVTNLMQRLPGLQINTHPPLLYYDALSRRLKFVDTRHFFVLANVDRTALEDDIPFPRDIESKE